MTEEIRGPEDQEQNTPVEEVTEAVEATQEAVAETQEAIEAVQAAAEETQEAVEAVQEAVEEQTADAPTETPAE